jgi:hypothetical protein
MVGRAGRTRRAPAAAALRGTADVDLRSGGEGGGGEVVMEVYVERSAILPVPQTAIGTPLSVADRTSSLQEFAASEAAVRAMLNGGPDAPEQLGPSSWRIKSPGIKGRGGTRAAVAVAAESGSSLSAAARPQATHVVIRGLGLRDPVCKVAGLSWRSYDDLPPDVARCVCLQFDYWV